MKRFIYLVFICIVKFSSDSSAQCGSNTPVYTVDLSGSPDSIWISPSVKRADTCCGGSGCIKFIVTIDTLAEAISLDIYSGAVPAGSLFYNVNCGGNVSIGTPICLSGKGPHRITFCKPGGNKNEYRIRSITKPNLGTDIVARA